MVECWCCEQRNPCLLFRVSLLSAGVLHVGTALFKLFVDEGA